MKKERMIKIIILLLMIVILAFLSKMVYNNMSYKIMEYKCVRKIVLEEAENEMNTKCNILSVKYDSNKKRYFARVVNEERNWSITYIVYPNRKKELYDVRKFIEEKGPMKGI